MGEKYNFENNNWEEIDQPSIVRINKNLVSITHADGEDITTIPDNGDLIIQIGNIESYDPMPTEPEPEPEITPNPNPSGGGNEGGNNEGSGSEGGEGQSEETPANSSYAEYTGESGIKFVLHNNTNSEARFTGKVILNVSRDPDHWTDVPQVYANFHGPQSGTSWDRNDIIIPVGGTWTSDTITSIDPVLPHYSGVNFTDGSWYFMNSDNGTYVHSIYLYTRMYSKSRNEISGSNHMYTAVPLKNTKLQTGYAYHLNINWINPSASLDPDMSGSSYIILQQNQTGLSNQQ